MRCLTTHVPKQATAGGRGGLSPKPPICTRYKARNLSVKMEAAAAAATSSTGMEPPARRGSTTCSRVPELQAVGDHLDG